MAHLYQTCFDDYLASGGDLRGLDGAYVADYGSHIHDSTVLYDGIAEALVGLCRLAKLALVTNKPEALSELLLTALGVRQHFAVVVGGDTCQTAKPDAEPLLHAMQAVGALPVTTLMIGDSPGDIACAHAAGTRVIWCAYGYKSAPGPRAPNGVAHHPSELVSAVQRLLAPR